MTDAAQSARGETRRAESPQSAREETRPAESARRRRIAGGAFVATGIVSAAVAVGFRVGFLTDPIGPRALPWLGSALLALGGMLMLLRSDATHPSVQKPVAYGESGRGRLTLGSDRVADPSEDHPNDRIPPEHRITPEQRIAPEKSITPEQRITPGQRITPEQRNVALALLTFLLYATILSAAGFVLSTALLMTLLARFYGGTWKRGIVAGVAFSASLWLLFVQALGVPLPVGSIFLIGG